MTANGRCFESGWCDLSPEHERIRRELEGLIKCYVEGCAEEYWMPVIVAPYGSGKTTLLRYLEEFARGLGVAALRVELSEIVDFIVERYGTVHESDLPRVIEEFAASRLGESSVYVLLIDEVEESYDLLRGVVTYETSPFRGVAEAIRTRASRAYVVLALGPSSTLKEAVFGPVAWRSRIYTLPLLPKSVIKRMVEVAVKDDADAQVVELLANMVWWASKGRIAWAKMLIDNVVPRLYEALLAGPEHVEALLLGEEALGREIVEGVPLFDRTGFREVKRLFEDKALTPFLAVLPGPVPSSLLSKLTGREVLPEPSLAVVFSRTVTSVDELVGEAQAWMERFARARGYGMQSVEHALTALEHVVAAWSLDGWVVFEPQALRELFSLAADVAREVYADDPHAAQLLESLNPDLLAPRVERGNEVYVALRPSSIARLYPSAGSSPLVGCARKAGARQVVEVVESLSLDELVDYSGRVATLTGADRVLERRELQLLLLPARLAQAYASELACRMAGGERLLVLLLSPNGRGSGIPGGLEAAARLTGSIVAEAGPRLSMFLYSLLYGYAVGTEGCSPESLAGPDRRVLRLYAELLRSLVLDSLAEPTGPASRVAASARLLEERYPALASPAAYTVAAGGGAAGHAEEVLKQLTQRVSSIEAGAIELLGSRSWDTPGLEEPLDALREAQKLYQLTEEEGLLEARNIAAGCKATGIPRVLRVLLGFEEPPPPPSLERAGEVIARLAAAARELPREGPLGRLAELANEAEAILQALEDAIQKLRGAAGLLEPHVRVLEAAVSALAEKAAAVARLYAAVSSSIQKLPDTLRSRAEEAVAADLKQLNTLDDVAAYMERAVQALAELVGLAERHEALRLEKLRGDLLSRLDTIISSLEGGAPARQEKAEGEALAG
ncbi:hypothetical protein [Hyperthermus butylicus]|uniref:Uncharacterized protein n=1 Tax=Hyperthermus butylicus (strain DSM 5456 / JCM 9403 / PLM1-5) TaxID=415426 RepID=A2BJS0_HYPBU|nr:hypothetical protein [Hyperthermus butylicus]ABM80231.1 hypothetical protein Hbut_0359 [Hyperthermus butylicus DSM 5456]